MDRRFGFDIDSIVRPEENGNSGNDREIDATIEALEQAVVHAVPSVLQDRCETNASPAEWASKPPDRLLIHENWPPSGLWAERYVRHDREISHVVAHSFGADENEIRPIRPRCI
jgi:hypothetical protein